jgi:MtN3 and saliva related transmembrane protein
MSELLTTAAYIPQTVKVLRTKHTQSLSLGMYALITSGIALWTVYGIMLESPSLIIANGLTLVMAAIILVMKIRHG